jgi:hypothetical protein
MNVTERIAAVKAKIAALEHQLTSSLLKEEKHDIRQQIIENTKLLTELYKQNAPAGENSYIPTDLTGSEVI